MIFPANKAPKSALPLQLIRRSLGEVSTLTLGRRLRSSTRRQPDRGREYPAGEDTIWIKEEFERLFVCSSLLPQRLAPQHFVKL
jgi:hypothetical protein